jgi:hypothetical protein
MCSGTATLQPGRRRQGLDQLLAGWLAGAADDVAEWVCRETQLRL